MREYNLDNAATTKMSESVLAAMMPYLTTNCYNPSALYTPAREVRKAIDKARAQVAKIINANPENIIFTSGGSEANNIAMYESTVGKPDCYVITSETEHESMYKAALHYGAHTMFINHTQDDILECVKNAVEAVEYIKNSGNGNKKDTIVSLMFTNNELGFTNPVEKVGNYANKSGVLFLTDCVQSLGQEIIDVQKIKCDFASFSSHKIHGPKGVGALYIKDIASASNHPAIFGGAGQEFGIRSGTENVAGIVGFGQACEDARHVVHNQNIMIKKRAKFLTGLSNALQGYRVNCECPYSKIISLTIDGINSESLVYMLSMRGVYVSSGSACHSSSQKPSRTLLAYGFSEEEALSTIRISLSGDMRGDDIDRSVAIIANAVNTLRQYRKT